MASQQDLDYLSNMPYIGLKQLNDTIVKRERIWSSLPATMKKGYSSSVGDALKDYNEAVKTVYIQRTEGT